MKKKNKDRRIVLFILIFLSGIVIRVFDFGIVPNGLNQDEAFAGYEAWNILTTHHDTMGYRFPLYLFTNGGGMNALETYLMVPFIAIFGPQDWVIRIPQVIIAILSLPAAYGVARRIYDEKAALWAMMIIAWCPWHIMMSRWGLESNLAPGMLLFGLYFFLRGSESRRFYFLSALMYGFALYSYAVVWMYVPIILLLGVWYLIREGRLTPKSRSLWGSAVIVAVFAAPLVLVLLVNYGYIGEIQTRFFSIPKLDFLRTSQTNGYTFWQNAENLAGILFLQSDGLIWNSPTKYGLYYSFGILFIMIGLAASIHSFCRKWKRREYAPEFFLFLQFLCGLFLGLTSHVNVNRVNIIFLPMLIMGGYGIEIFCSFCAHILPRWTKWVSVGAACLYLVSFLCFAQYYFTEYRQESAAAFDSGLKDALAEGEKSGKTIHINKSGIYPKVLYYVQMPVDEYMNTRVFSDWHPMPKSAGNLYFDMEQVEPDRNSVFILEEGADLSAFVQEGFEVEKYGSCSYVYYPE